MRTLLVLVLLAALAWTPACNRGDTPKDETTVAVGDVEQAPAEGEFEPFDTPPTLLEASPPEYPEDARAQRLEGTVQVKVLVRADGGVESAAIAETSGNLGLDRAAIEAVEGYRFTPATRNGEPVPCTVIIPFRYKLN